jgi:hypothetical protein
MTEERKDMGEERAGECVLQGSYETAIVVAF